MPGPGGGGGGFGLMDMMSDQPAVPAANTAVQFMGLPPGFAGGAMQTAPGLGGAGGSYFSNPMDAAFGNPGAWGMSRQDFADPLAYSAHNYQPRDTGGWYTTSQLYDRMQGGALNPLVGAGIGSAIGPGGRGGGGGGMGQIAAAPGQNVPAYYKMGQDRPSTSNWRLLPPPYNTPRYLMRNGQIIDLLQSSIDTGQKNVMGAETQADRNRPGYAPWNPSGNPFVQSYSFGHAASGWPGQPSGWSIFSTDIT